MILCDVNILVYAYREDADRHPEYREWLEDVVNRPDSFGFSTLVLSGFLRVVTHARIFEPPSPLADARRFIEPIVERPNAIQVNPGYRHWEIFMDLCRRVEAKGNLIPDAYLAALSIESGCEWITADRGFSRFPGLKWRSPLAET